MKLSHLSKNYMSSDNLCGAPVLRGNLRTSSTPTRPEHWDKICPQCKIQYDLDREEEQERQRIAWERTPPPTFREKVERFARFGSGGSDHYYLVPLLLLHSVTLGLSTVVLSAAQKVAQWYSKPTKSTIAPSIPIRLKKEDLETTNLFVGKIIDDGSIKCEVVDVHNTNIHVKILEIKWERLGTYLDIGKVYPVFKHRNTFSDDKMQVFEISPKHMKRNTSQVLLFWEKEIGWTWDLDS